MGRERAIIIGGGPAGLTAAYELQKRSAIQPIVLEKSHIVGGLSRTENYKGNRIDIGGHRFFSKSDRVMQWWFNILPPQIPADAGTTIAYQGSARTVSAPARPDPSQTDRLMLLRERRSRIYFLRRFFDYPVRLSAQTLRNLGLIKSVRIGISYFWSALFPIRNERNLEEFFINRFGRELYQTFFQSYTEKVWGVPCRAISAEWGAQRIKGLSIWRAFGHALRQLATKNEGVAQKQTETSLIERFLYPKYGPGQMWEEVARQVRGGGGEVRLHADVQRVIVEGNRVRAIEVRQTQTGETARVEGDYFFSTMPIQELVRKMSVAAPSEIRRISDGLVYRDFMTVGLLLKQLKVCAKSENGVRLIRDNWIYIQEPDVKVGRLQVFNNWSPYMVADPSNVWIGLEYFCNEGDEIWNMSDAAMIEFAKEEVSRIGIIEMSQVLDGCVLRMPKTYPAYFGTYAEFDALRAWLDQFENLFLVGRNGMHKYNNQDHSMLTAMIAVDNIVSGRRDKENIWAVNTEQDYHEAKEES